MALADVAAVTPKKKQGTPCSIGVLLDTLDAADSKWLASNLAADTRVVQHSWIARVLAGEGHRVAAMTVGRHRLGGCGCPR